MMDLQEATALLAQTPPAFDALLRGLPATWTSRNEGDGTWAPIEIVAHLIHAERTDWMPRAKMILQSGEGEAFAPFERGGHVREMEGKSLEQLLDELARARSANLAELRALNLRRDDLDRRGRHPSLGAVTLSQLLATWVVHDLTHLHQISRVMAHQYREAVGPWRRPIVERQERAARGGHRRQERQPDDLGAPHSIEERGAEHGRGWLVGLHWHVPRRIQLNVAHRPLKG
jgi:hypothetical protein